jgi:outer membrane cobalamin receptor
MIPLVFLVMLVAQPIYELDEIVVTATRYPAALQDIALATVVIDKEELDKLNAISVGEVLQAYAGADIKDYGNPGSVSSISIRGIPRFRAYTEQMALAVQ